MRYLLVLLFSPALFAACTGSSPTWTTTSDQASVSTCITNAASGDTINIQAGTSTWASPPALPNTKSLTIIGTGTTNTIITLSSTWEMTCSATHAHRIGGIQFTGGVVGSYLIHVTGTCTTSPNIMRFDHNWFKNIDSGTDAIVLNAGQALAGEIHGLIDNNTFSSTGQNFRAVLIFGNVDYGTKTNCPAVDRLGTDRNTFIEDNVFDFADGSNVGAGVVDSNSCAAFVFRYNTMTNSAGITSHGVCNSEGTISQEAYGNALIANASAGFPTGTRLIHNQGSGEAIYFGNRFTATGTKSTEAMNVQHYRSGPNASTGCSLYNRCDGAEAADGNTSPSGTYYGYPCRYQPGRKHGNALSPMYAWDNKWSDTLAKVSLNIEDNWTGPPYASTHVQANRDFYDENASFTGATGMGVGTIASRPATCTTNAAESGGGVGYWATDEGNWNARVAGADGRLYRCSATNTWSLHYTPYTYPHPLQGFDPVTPRGGGGVRVGGGAKANE